MIFKIMYADQAFMLKILFNNITLSIIDNTKKRILRVGFARIFLISRAKVSTQQVVIDNISHRMAGARYPRV